MAARSCRGLFITIVESEVASKAKNKMDTVAAVFETYYGTWLLSAICVVLTLVLSFVRFQPKNHPPGPMFRMPFMGNAYIFRGNPIKNISALRKRYGDTFSIDVGPFRQIMVCDLDVLRDMMSMDVFSGRGKPTVMGINIFANMKGGHGGYGLVTSEGDEWKEQRRFALKHLKDFGFGRSSMEDIIHVELLDLSEYLQSMQGQELETNQLFNLYVMNTLWCMMCGSRYDLKDKSQLKRLEEVERLVSEFGPTNPSFIYSVMLPKFLRKRLGFDIVDRIHEFFDFFRELYAQHERTFDPAQLRDFIDVYCAERRRVRAKDLRDSSFYGEDGNLNYVNTMFDLFLVGSETTTTFLRFFLLYMINFPSVQSRIQAELDKVVGRSRMPSLTDGKSLPFTEAVIHEIHRHATISYISVNHAPMHDTTYSGYNFLRTDMITPCLYEVHRDPKNFPDPDSFDPTRFVDPASGSFSPHPAVVPYGFGKRECLGKSLAKAEVFLFTTCLLQKFTFFPPSSGAPDLDDVVITMTRSPNPFKVRVESRS